MIGTLQDITEQRRATAALRESEELYSTLVETSPDAVTVTDLEGRITFVSTRTVELHGCTSKEDLIGRSALDFIVPKELKRAVKNMQKTLEKGSIRNIEYLLLRVDGSQFVGELNASVIKDAKGNAKAFIATVRDMTARKRAQEKLRQATGELQTKHKALLEKNIALTEILNHIEDQRQDYKQQICREIEQAILPAMQRAKLEEITSFPKMLENLEANLKSILSRDIDVLRNRLSKLSPREIEICDLIKRGKTSKEISDILSLALTTVQTHRQQIRRKLEIAGKEVNLSTFLRMS
jgi:PAS domain S-box-containing protein